MTLTVAQRKQVEQAFADKWLLATVPEQLLNQNSVRQISDDIRKQFEEEGRELFFGKDGVHGYWDGQYALAVREAMALIVTGQIQDLLMPALSIICPTYCALKAQGILDSKGLEVAFVVADSLIASKTACPVPVTTLAAYVADAGILSKLCSCVT